MLNDECSMLNGCRQTHSTLNIHHSTLNIFLFDGHASMMVSFAPDDAYLSGSIRNSRSMVAPVFTSLANACADGHNTAAAFPVPSSSVNSQQSGANSRVAITFALRVRNSG